MKLKLSYCAAHKLIWFVSLHHLIQCVAMVICEHLILFIIFISTLNFSNRVQFVKKVSFD